MIADSLKDIIFDVDGTLIDSSTDVVKCLKKAYEKEIGHIDREIDRRIIGPPLKQMIIDISPQISEDSIAKIIENFKSFYDDSGFPNTRAFPDVKKTLLLLRNKNLRLFIATNKRSHILSKQLKMTGLNDIFLDCIASDFQQNNLNKSEMIGLLIQKWKISLSSALMIGDHEGDIKAAKFNGIRSAAALYGYGEAKLLREAEPEYIIKNIKDLIKIKDENE